MEYSSNSIWNSEIMQTKGMQLSLGPLRVPLHRRSIVFSCPNVRIRKLTCITLIGSPVSLANCSRMWRVGFGVWLNAFFSTSSCFALIVVRGPRRFDPFAPSSGLLFSACESPRQSGSPSIDACERQRQMKRSSEREHNGNSPDRNRRAWFYYPC